jgi:predicted transcriptional regulator
MTPSTKQRSTKPREEVKSIYVGLRVEPELRRKLEDLARATDLTITQIVRRAVRTYLEKGVA